MTSATPSKLGPGSLTPEQLHAINHPANHILVVASAGSGKTEVLTQRLARILSESAGDSFRCLAVTYTVKASEELRRRIAATTASETWRTDADTLHGFCLDWLRQYGGSVGVPPNVVVYSDEADRAKLVFDYLVSLGLGAAVGADEMSALRPVLKSIDDHRTLRPGQEFSDDGSVYLGVPVSELYAGYLDAMDQAGGIDFPGMLWKFFEALDADPWIGSNFRSLFRHVLVDEAQDLTPIQTALLRRLVLDQVAVFAVADDRQSINGFAGGSFENARQLVGPDAVRLTLPHNFRSSLQVLQAAESLARHFRSSSVRPQRVEQAPPGEVTVRACADPKDEAAEVAAWVERLLAQGLTADAIATGEDPTIQLEDVAVLGRTRWALDPVLEQLGSRRIPTAVQVEASGFLTTPEGRITIDALALEANPSDRPAQRRILEELHGLGVYGGEDSKALDGPGLSALLADTDVESLVPVAELLREVRAPSGLGTGISALTLPATGAWARDAAALRSLWHDYRASTEIKYRSIDGFLRYVSRSERVRPTDPGVRVMTIHKAKGLEFRAVALVGAREGTIPYYLEKDAKGLDAERRAFYVAITRASRALLVTWPRHTQDRYGRTHVQERTRFLGEAGL